MESKRETEITRRAQFYKRKVYRRETASAGATSLSVITHTHAH